MGKQHYSWLPAPSSIRTDKVRVISAEQGVNEQTGREWIRLELAVIGSGNCKVVQFISLSHRAEWVMRAVVEAFLPKKRVEAIRRYGIDTDHLCEELVGRSCYVTMRYETIGGGTRAEGSGGWMVRTWRHLRDGRNEGMLSDG